MTRPYLPTSPDHLTGGRWMRDTWGVNVWVQIEPTEDAPDKAVVCTTCPAQAWESCMTPSGKPSGTHAGRLVPRQCRCGAAPRSKTARMCQACMAEADRVSSNAYQARKRSAA